MRFWFDTTSWITDGQHARLKKLSADWAEMLRRGEFVKNFTFIPIGRLSIWNCKSCIVGMAHHCDERYGECYRCRRLSNNFVDARADGPRAFRKLLGKFLDHFEEEHPHLIKKPLVCT